MMTPEYLEQLAEVADPDQVWRTPLLEQFSLSAEKRRQMDMGIALRRHASHIRDLQALIGTGRSLLLTPYSPSTTAVATIETPEKHRRPAAAARGGA